LILYCHNFTRKQVAQISLNCQLSHFGRKGLWLSRDVVQTQHLCLPVRRGAPQTKQGRITADEILITIWVKGALPGPNPEEMSITVKDATGPAGWVIQGSL
jgi:hypothetical protein